MYSKSLCYLDTMITPRIRMNILLALKSIRVTSPQEFYLFASWMTPQIQTPPPNTSCTSRTWQASNNESITRMMWRIEIYSETRVQVLWYLWFTNSCPNPWSTDTSRSARWTWPIWVGITANSSTIHKSTIRDASSGRGICWLRVSYW